MLLRSVDAWFCGIRYIYSSSFTLLSFIRGVLCIFSSSFSLHAQLICYRPETVLALLAYYMLLLSSTCIVHHRQVSER